MSTAEAPQPEEPLYDRLIIGQGHRAINAPPSHIDQISEEMLKTIKFEDTARHVERRALPRTILRKLGAFFSESVEKNGESYDPYRGKNPDGK